MNDKSQTLASDSGGPTLSGAALDMAVAQALRMSPQLRDERVYVNGVRFAPSRDWADGGPLIERYRMRIQVLETPWVGREVLWSGEFPAFGFEKQGFAHGWSSGPTPLVAAMRALVEARGLYRSAQHEGVGWQDARGRDTLALVVELVRLAGTHRPLELHDVQGLVQAAILAGVPLSYRFGEQSDAAYSKDLSEDLSQLAALGVLRLRHDRESGATRYLAGAEVENYLRSFRTLLHKYAGSLHAVVQAVMG